MRDTLKPKVSIFINDYELPDTIMRSLQSVEVDLTFGMADQIKMTISNPVNSNIGGFGDNQFIWMNSKLLMPGNQIDVFLGWGDDLQHISSGIIQKWLPEFPEDGVPSIQIVALDASCLLMDEMEAKSFPLFDFDLVIKDILNKHGIVPGNIVQLPGTARENLFKKRGMSDFAFVKSITNITGMQFKVYYDFASKQWKGDWTDFSQSTQTLKYKFEYRGQGATLLSFSPSWGLRNSPNEVKLMYFDKSTGTFEEVSAGSLEVSEKTEITKSQAEAAGAATAAYWDMKEKVTSMSRLRVGAGDAIIEIIPDRRFDNQDVAIKWAESWLKARRDNFITGQGKMVGLETLKPGQVHEIVGCGVILDGDWEIRTARHVFNTSGYFVEFDAHKVLTE